MYLKYSIGFLIASLIQFGIIYLGEILAITNLQARTTTREFIIHIALGQIAGFLLLYGFRKLNFLKNTSYWVAGVLYGTIVWLVLTPIQAALGKIALPWGQNITTVLVSLIAFITYGIIVAYTIKRYGYEKRNYTS